MDRNENNCESCKQDQTVYRAVTGLVSIVTLLGGFELRNLSEGLGNDIIMVGIGVGTLAVYALLELGFHAIPEHPRKEKWEKDFPRVRELKKLLDQFSDSQKRTYKSLPDEDARLNWLEDNAPGVVSLLDSPDGIPAIRLVDAYFIGGLRDYFIFFGKTDDTSLIYELLAYELPACSIDRVNRRVAEEKSRAEKVWKSLPDKTRIALRFAETAKEQEKMQDEVTDTMPSFYQYYPLIYVSFIRDNISSIYTHTYGDEYEYKILLNAR